MNIIFFLIVLLWWPNLRCDESNNTLKCENKCILSRNRKFMFCARLNLTTVPACLDDLQTLDLCENFLLRLSRKDFADKVFHKLETLILCNSSVKIIEDDAFIGLKHLRELDLSVNLLKSMPPQTFSNNKLLERLNLSTNLIKILEYNQFDLPRLEILDLSNCFLKYIDETALSKLPELKWLNLRNNQLKILPPGVHVQVLLLGGSNPWNCDCVFYSLSKNQINLSENDFSCLDADQKFTWNETSLTDGRCDQYFRISKSKLLKKNDRTDNSPELILDVYGYVLMGVAFVIFVCCCCNKTTKQFGGESKTPTGELSHRISLQAEMKEQYDC